MTFSFRLRYPSDNECTAFALTSSNKAAALVLLSVLEVGEAGIETTSGSVTYQAGVEIMLLMESSTQSFAVSFISMTPSPGCCNRDGVYARRVFRVAISASRLSTN